jgi:hypothetical protein
MSKYFQVLERFLAEPYAEIAETYEPDLPPPPPKDQEWYEIQTHPGDMIFFGAPFPNGPPHTQGLKKAQLEYLLKLLRRLK